MKLVLDAPERVADWVAGILPNMSGGSDFGPQSAIGVSDNGEIVAGIVYSNFHELPFGPIVEASMAATTPRWATRSILRGIFAYPFSQLGAVRIQVTLAKGNKHGRKIVERLGFKYEGKGRRAWDGRHDAVAYSMLADECIWIRKRHGKESS